MGVNVSGGGGASAGAVVREGGQTTEAQTTSTTAVDLITAATLTIAALEPYFFIGSARKTIGAAANAGLGLKENGTVVLEAVAAGSAKIWRADSTDEAEAGSFAFHVSPRLTSYLDGNIVGAFRVLGGNTHRLYIGGPTDAQAASHVNAQLTDLILRGITGNASLTLAADELHAYSWAAS